MIAALAGGEHIYNQFKSGNWTMHRNGELVSVDDMAINPNSLNLTLGNKVLIPRPTEAYVDFARAETLEWELEEFEEFFLRPKQFFLFHTAERIDCTNADEYGNLWVPKLDGRSSVGRGSVKVHFTAGFGDFSFDSTWTLEVETSIPVILRPGMPLCQVSFETVLKPYVYDGAYTDQHDGPKAPVYGPERFGFQRESP